MPTSDGEGFRLARFYSCPLGDALSPDGWASGLLGIYRHSGRGERLTTLLEAPTVAAWEAVDLLNAEIALVDKRATKQAEERAALLRRQAAGRR